VTISEQGSILSVNKVVHKIFGYRVEELVGKDISTLMPEPFASKHGQYMAKYLQTGQAGIIGIGRELPAIKKDGSTFPMEFTISEMMNGEEKVFIGIVRDISERKKSEQYIQQLTYYDDITESFNRLSFDKDISECLESSRFIQGENSIFLINIDKFSQINLIYGEIIGDEILKCIVKRIKELLPPWANIYRNSADNFFIIFKSHEAISFDDDSMVTNNAMADKILHYLSSPFKVDGKSITITITITVSIGILDLTDIEIDKSDVKPLLELSVHKAKSHGGNQFVYAKRREHAYLKRHSELTMALKDSHFIKEVSLVVQPQYDVSGNIVGSEALVRWNSPSFGFVSPEEFIPLAEQNGKIVDIGSWVIEQVCLLAAQRRLFTTEHNPVSINVSAKQIAQPSFSKHLTGTLTKHKIPPSEVVIELNESTLIADFDLVINVMTNLRAEGFNFSVDDFGTGYSSLSYLQKLPIAELKIDKSFIDDINHASDHVQIVNSIIQMAKELDLKIVAEGVETKEQLEYLEMHGCEIIQGYLFSKPLSVDQWLKQFCAV
jgi:PAS domain S-box-containing protein/diguanylate cyclase (GGDEF)-like protein